MEILLLALGGVCVWLWRRTQMLEKRIFSLEEHGTHGLAQEPSDLAEGKNTAPSLDAVKLEPLPLEAEAEPSKTLPSETYPAPTEEHEAAEDRHLRFAVPEFDFEDIFGRRLPIWAGGIALAVGGIFLVIYSIEQGLLGPTTRVALSFLFGILLLSGAEAAHRLHAKLADPRVAQALAGAGIATLYAAFYLAGARYGLVSPGIAFAGLALVTAIALGLTFRFGLPTAVLGLIGGFITPLLVASESPNIPILAFYLSLLTAGLALTARKLGQRWLGVAALLGGFGWGVLMLLAGPLADGDAIALGLYLFALGAAIPLMVGEDTRLPFMRVVAGIIASAQLAALVSLAGFNLLTWGLYLLLAAALAILSWRENNLRPANTMALAVGIVLLSAWFDPTTGAFVGVALALSAIGLGLPLVFLYRERGTPLDLVQLSLGALAMGWVSHFQFGSYDNTVFAPGMAATFASLAAACAVGTWCVWKQDSFGRWIALPAGASALLGFFSFHALLPEWAEVIGAALVTLLLAELAQRAPRQRLLGLVWAGAFISLLALLSTGDVGKELSIAVGSTVLDHDIATALTRFLAAAAPFCALAAIEQRQRAARMAEGFLALLVYAAIAQIIPADLLPWTVCIAVVALAWQMADRAGAWRTLIGIGFLWALVPMMVWFSIALGSLTGEPVLLSDLPSLSKVLLRAAPLALAAGFVIYFTTASHRERTAIGVVALVTGTAALHVPFKHVFALDVLSDFVAFGLAERTVWQAILVASGITLLHFRPTTSLHRAGLALVYAGALHFIVYSFSLHNPLWAPQAVGWLPIANWLIPAYGVASLAIWALCKHSPDNLHARVRPARDALLMVLIGLWALSELRHASSGNILTDQTMTQSEDLLRSLLGIVLALAFLWWGSRTGQRSWRIGSLILMLAAVAKVFLVDAAGLEGLLRAGSFIALGLSLIGTTMFYTRQLRSIPADSNR